MDEHGRSSASPSLRPTSTDEPRTRGFLFCDLRGYTSFVEGQGDRAAAELLGDFRAIVRDAIRSTDGGEVRTEGDSFYVVFPSASSAIRCGLAIVDGTAQASTERPELPIRVGVGIHAGEAVEEGEGYVGSAVNIAARVCSLAQPGEVLVTDTVRSLVRTSLPVTFRSRGRPRLKGIAEPIDLFAVTAAAADRPAASPAPSDRAPSRRRMAIVGLGILLVLVVAGPLWASVLLRATDAPRSSGDPSSQPGGSRAGGSDVVLADVPGRIAFLSYQLEPGAYLPRRQIRVADPDGTEPMLVSGLLSDVYTFRPSSDGRQIAFTMQYDLLISDLDGSSPEPWPGSWWTFDFGRGQKPAVPIPFDVETWFSDGSLLVHPVYTARHFRISADGDTVEPTPIDGDDVAGSPIDDSIVALRQNDAQGSGIWIVPAGGQADIPDIPLTKGLDAAQPAWSPDGTTIAFSGREPGGALGIWTVASNGSGRRRLTDGAADKHPAWSPDGRWIAFDRTTGGERRLWIVRPDGTGLTRLPLGAEGEQIDSPVWLPSPG